MRKIRNLTIVTGALLMFLTLAAVGARGQALTLTDFEGSFTLPFMAQWGNQILPPGDYELNYGSLENAGSYVVEIRGQGGLPQGIFIVAGRNNTKSTENVIVFVMEDGKAHARTLDLPAIGLAAQFARPHAVSVQSWIVAGNSSPKANTLPANGLVSIVRVPVKPVK